MRAVVVYESMYGNTHQIAEAVGEGLRESFPTDVLPVCDASPRVMDGVDLVVVGGPTHTHGMSHASTRQAAVATAADSVSTGLQLDPAGAVAGDGVREWLDSLGTMTGRAAAFDTRVDISTLLSGRASRGIAKQLARHGYDVVLEPESFLVTKDTRLLPDEQRRALQWGQRLGLRAQVG